jgi:tRNA uridine 5-carboxymethylaminomethyl modification enzyme
MFTSRAEHRLLFNHASAELRLLDHARKNQLVSASRLARIENKQRAIERWIARLEQERSTAALGTWADGIRRDRTGAALPPDLSGEAESIRDNVVYRIAYKGYLEREERQISKMSEVEKLRLPEELNYMQINGLRKESALKLSEIRPMTLGQASRISGVNPADISILLVWMQAGRGGESRKTSTPD